MVVIACPRSGAVAEPTETQREGHEQCELEAERLRASKQVLHFLIKLASRSPRPAGLPLLAERLSHQRAPQRRVVGPEDPLKPRINCVLQLIDAFTERDARIHQFVAYSQ